MNGDYEEALERIREIERRMRELETLLRERLDRLEAEVKKSGWK